MNSFDGQIFQNMQTEAEYLVKLFQGGFPPTKTNANVLNKVKNAFKVFSPVPAFA